MTKTLVFALLTLTTAAFATAPSRHESWVRAKLATLPQTPEDRTSDSRSSELDALAASVANVSRDAPRSPQEWAALMLAIGSHETNMAGRLLRGECRLEKRECDAAKRKDGTWYARARGWGQVWRNDKNGEIWDAAETDIVAQTKLVDAQLRMAYHRCARSGVPWVRATLNGYLGVRCGADWPGLGKREQTFRKLVGGGAS